MGLKFLSTVFCVCTLAACATAPSSQTASTKSVALKQPTSVEHRHHRSKDPLTLCRGMKISNAPRANANRQVIGLSNASYVRSVSLERSPVDNACLSSGFGPRRGGASGFHKGIDLYTGKPVPIRASAPGKIVQLGAMRGYGNTILIRHRDGVETRYAHLSAYGRGLKPGVWVKAGQEIGRTGRTGNATAVHLHYEVLVAGKPQDPLAPPKRRAAAGY